MLSSIMVLTSLLGKNIREYQAALNAYDQCNPAVCTLGRMHAKMLFQNSSFILKYVCYICKLYACDTIFALQC